MELTSSWTCIHGFYQGTIAELDQKLSEVLERQFRSCDEQFGPNYEHQTVIVKSTLLLELIKHILDLINLVAAKIDCVTCRKFNFYNLWLI